MTLEQENFLHQNKKSQTIKEKNDSNSKALKFEPSKSVRTKISERWGEGDLSE